MAEQKRAEIEKINLRLQKLLDSFLDELIDRETYVAEKSKEMSRKKSLEEESAALLKGRADWLEPFQNWIKTARNAGESNIADSFFAKEGSRSRSVRLEPCPRLQKSPWFLR
jgi:hypothetical protein